MAYLGIDYGLGLTNVDHATGIRFGVISQHSLASWFYDSFEAVYGPATCPKCGDEAIDQHADEDEPTESADGSPLGTVYALGPDEDEDEDWNTGKDYRCDVCRYCFWSDEAYGDEPIGHKLDEDGIHAEDCLDSDVIVTSSPFYTFGPFCSPCVPGAVNLDSTHEDESGPKAYCFGHEWFEDGKAPYRVFRVVDNVEVFPEAK
jgi:hypothetical protein